MRPHTNEVATATYDLSVLASRHHPRDDPRQSSGFDDVAAVVGQFLWICEEIRRERAHASYPRGNPEGLGVRTLHRGSEVTDLDARTHDQHVKELRAAQRDMLHELGMFRDRNDQRLEKLVGRQGVGQVAQ